MSVHSTIDICFAGDAFTPFMVFELLCNHGWTPCRDESISFLPLGDNGAFDWKDVECGKLNLVKEIIKRQSDIGETIGVTLVLEEIDCGGELLIFPDRRMSMVLSINRKLLPSHSRVTDINWYVAKVIECFTQSSIQIESICWQEHY